MVRLLGLVSTTAAHVFLCGAHQFATAFLTVSDISRTTWTRLDSRSSRLRAPGLFGEKSLDSKPNKKTTNGTSDWTVYIDQSKSSLDRGGSATLDAFVGLAPSTVQVLPAILPKLSKAKGPLVRCVCQIPGRPSLDVSNVDSVDKVYRILTRHMQVASVSANACDCLKWKYKGNAHLEAGKVELAIDAYSLALATGVERQEGIVLLLRASAYLSQAETHKVELQKTVDELTDMVPESENLKALILATKHTPLANSILTKVLHEGKRQEVQFRQTQFRHGLYQYALLHAAQDSLRATELLSSYPTSWLRAGEILSGLWKLKESTQYYERAIGLDNSLEAGLAPVIERLKKRQDLLERARAYGWPEDTLRLALDVAVLLEYFRLEYFVSSWT